MLPPLVALLLCFAVTTEWLAAAAAPFSVSKLAKQHPTLLKLHKWECKQVKTSKLSKELLCFCVDNITMVFGREYCTQSAQYCTLLYEKKPFAVHILVQHEKQLQQNEIIHHGKHGESLFYPYFAVFSYQCCIMLLCLISITHVKKWKQVISSKVWNLIIYSSEGYKLYIDRGGLFLIICLFKVSLSLKHSVVLYIEKLL